MREMSHKPCLDQKCRRLEMVEGPVAEAVLQPLPGGEKNWCSDVTRLVVLRVTLTLTGESHFCPLTISSLSHFITNKYRKQVTHRLFSLFTI